MERKQTSFSGHVKNNTIILDTPVFLPEGAKVTVIVSPPTLQGASGLCGIWQDDRPIEDIVQDITGARSAGHRGFDDVS